MIKRDAEQIEENGTADADSQVRGDDLVLRCLLGSELLLRQLDFPILFPERLFVFVLALFAKAEEQRR